MISRLSAFAAVFAVLTTATLAIAASTQSAPAARETPRVVQLETVTVIGKRLVSAPN